MNKLLPLLLLTSLIVSGRAAEPTAADKEARAIHERLAPFFRPPAEFEKGLARLEGRQVFGKIIVTF